MSYFSLNPEKRVYIREFSRIINENINSVRRELINLENIGLLIVEEESNLKYYKMNNHSPIYEEITKIFLKTKGLLSVIKNNLKKYENIDTAFIYGSYASGSQKFDSDLDLFIVGEINEDFLVEEFYELEKEYSKEINYVLFTRKEIKEGLKDKNSFILEVVENPKIFLIEDSENILKINRY
ncbi:MAG: nucleotidyltransferase domain-containing protein [Methanobrevibacter sp.]|nr:nucleotidyltransferase domain-containing protein [Candidatus Methanovirga aequatorialis]